MAELKSTIVNGFLSINGDLIASAIKKRGGTSNDILLADGTTTAKSSVKTTITITDTTSDTTHPLIGDITISGDTITVTRKSLTDLGLAAALKYQGSKASYSNLPTTGNVKGDVWNVNDTGKNYAWSGEAWDDLGGTIDLSGLQPKDADLTAIAGITATSGFLRKTAADTWSLLAGSDAANGSAGSIVLRKASGSIAANNFVIAADNTDKAKWSFNSSTYCIELTWL